MSKVAQNAPNLHFHIVQPRTVSFVLRLVTAAVRNLYLWSWYYLTFGIVPNETCGQDANGKATCNGQPAYESPYPCISLDGYSLCSDYNFCCRK